MTGIYFSGTGNSRYAAEFFCRDFDEDSMVLSIEDPDVVSEIKRSDLLIFAYPVQFSTVPKILRDFIKNNSELWKDKRVYVSVQSPSPGHTSFKIQSLYLHSY